MEKTEIYKKRVWEFLEQIPRGRRYKVAEQCKTQNRELFISAIKEYMAAFRYQGNITFNHDYSEFYKMDPVPTTASIQR